jgi:uroporphyrinogen-III decarboxylase
MVKTAHERGMHVLMHACGDIKAFLSRLIDLGVDVIHPIQKYAMDENEVADEFGGRITFWAGFDVQRIIPYGTPEEVRAEVRHLVDTYCRPDGGLLLTAGNGVTEDTPMDSLEALLDEAWEYGQGTQ